ncbi:PrsW family glutamic-type intramembrane protease [Fibrobacter sp. UWB11]|uniref:PrsW family glutamic-type intramembrane protease n=1 Tax=Fibrobacter sp. UWB11 TaxID=1896202 RepID=UPI000927F675|nr:PrsW family glutamic-type intramembrane protease [Fibrobacter sp. UWB11]SIO00839.1 Membrane proteinase PrsW, cleaves anti-sigma factor RsiW, M82 family [Fibrobacter sp. UWB11]
MIYAENVLICIAVPLAITLLFTKGSARRLTASFLVGMIVCIVSAYISGYVQVLSDFSAEDTSIFLSPMIEECMKLLSMLFCVYVSNPSDDEIQLCAVGIGAGFATFENCCFILSSGAPQLANVLVRGAAVGVMHIVTLVALAKGMQLLKTYKAFSLAGIAGVLSLSVTVHGLYNLLVSKPGVSSYIGYVMPMICAIMLYMINGKTNQ